MPRRASAKLPQLSFIFTPQGFVPDVTTDAESGKPRLASESLTWYDRFEKDRKRALYDLGFATSGPWFTPSMRYLHRIADVFLRNTLQQPDVELLRENAAPKLEEMTTAELLLALPFCPGSEYVDDGWLARTWTDLTESFAADISSWDGTVEQYVTSRTQDLRVPGRIFFHLVDNPQGADKGLPFAFVATYATSEQGEVRHFPLRYALTQYEGDQHKVLGLLADLSRAADTCPFVSDLMESGELFHPLGLTEDETYAFLKAIPAIEEAGILCRVPTWWKRKASSARVNVRVGQERPDGLGAGAIIALSPQFVVDGEELTEQEIRDLLERTEGLAMVKGRWVEVDHERLQALLDAFEEARGKSLSVFEAIRAASEDAADDDLVQVTRGEWLDGLLQRMRTPTEIGAYDAPASLHATLRPYQQTGFNWLSYLRELGFGACLADDMGLGKTVQLIAFLERMREEAGEQGVRALLVVPASLVGNWQHELGQFAPDLDYQVLHGTSAPKLNERWGKVPDDELRAALPTLSITTYTMAQRLDVVARTKWDVLVLDEAQAIKNPDVKQTRTLKALSAGTRIALTGTPVENDLSNLWSVFDFVNPGMLGTLKEFKGYVSELETSPSGYAPLRQVIAPFLLRRLKTDRSIISDLPEKTEINQYVELARKQVVLYRKVVAELEESLANEDLSDTRRRGLVLAAIMRLKQICNHPDQYLGQAGFAAKDSAKFQMLAELCQTIYEKRERVLVFTQFREMCEPLARLLEGVFERPGCIIHGQIPAKRRTKLVERFQGEEYVPFMVLSVKAAGTGLNLTAANNVIHFDRWWNPAVENQATDRAFRIGQTKNVMVHKLVCQSTLEERIDKIIQGKSELVEQVVGSGETWLGNLDDEQLMGLLRFGSGR